MKSIGAKLAGCVVPIVLLATGCSGTHSFTTAARGGETVALAVGYRQHLQRQNMTVKITDYSGTTVTYPVSDPRVRGVVNLYPDPVSKLRVGYDTGQKLGVNALYLTDVIQGNNYPGGGGTSGDSDWWITTLLLDLPTTMANGNLISTGMANIVITDTGGNAIPPVSVEILPGTSSKNLFNIYGLASGFTFDALTQYPNVLPGLERADHFIVTFQTTQDANGYDILPYSMQVSFTHTPSVGVAQVLNARSDLKNVTFTDDGSNLKVMLTSPDGNAMYFTAKDLKFYIAGGLSNVALNPASLKAYDITGSPITGVTATVTAQ